MGIEVSFKFMWARSTLQRLLGPTSVSYLMMYYGSISISPCKMSTLSNPLKKDQGCAIASLGMGVNGHSEWAANGW